MIKRITTSFAALTMVVVFLSGCAGSGGGTVIAPAAVAAISPDLVVDMVATASSDGIATVIDPIKNYVDKTEKTVSIVSQPTLGTATMVGNTISYTATDGALGTDSFIYSVNGKNAVVIVLVFQTYIQHQPGDVVIASSSGNAVVINLLKNGTSTQNKTITITQAPAHGTATVITSVTDTGKVSYTANAGASGLDEFAYSVDGGVPKKVTIGIVLAKPLAVNDTVEIKLNSMQIVFGSTITTLNVLDNDMYIVNKNITIETKPTLGTVIVNAGTNDTPTITYTTTRKTSGTDSFTYSVDGSSPATVSITLTLIDGRPDPAQYTVNNEMVVGAIPPVVTLNSFVADTAYSLTSTKYAFGTLDYSFNTGTYASSLSVHNLVGLTMVLSNTPTIDATNMLIASPNMSDTLSVPYGSVPAFMPLNPVDGYNGISGVLATGTNVVKILANGGTITDGSPFYDYTTRVGVNYSLPVYLIGVVCAKDQSYTQTKTWKYSNPANWSDSTGYYVLTPPDNNVCDQKSLLLTFTP